MAPRLEPAETLIAGEDADVELLADHTYLALSASRFAAGAGPTPPLHVHAGHAEVFYVLDGTLRFQLEDCETVAGAGSWVVMPPGVTHTFRTDGAARFLDLHAPSCGYGTFVRTLSAAASEEELARARAAFDQQAPPATGCGGSIVSARSSPDGESIIDRPRRRVMLLVDSEWLAVTESVYGPGERGPDPHVHHDHTDAFLVLEGALELAFTDGTLRAPAGTFVLVPPDVVHSFANADETPARFFNLHAPSCGFGEYLRGRNPGFDQHEPLADGGSDPASVVACSLGI
jgi:quercetin dioxygenase-like cupin family protein